MNKKRELNVLFPSRHQILKNDNYITEVKTIENINCVHKILVIVKNSKYNLLNK